VCFKTIHADARGTGRGAWDEMNWEGEAPAEPKRQRVASGE